MPKGFAHGFQTLTEDCEVLYKVTDYYAPAAEAGLLWSDPALGIAWPGLEAVINARDGAWPAPRGSSTAHSPRARSAKVDAVGVIRTRSTL